MFFMNVTTAVSEGIAVGQLSNVRLTVIDHANMAAV
jgi:hypothetical protein